MVTVGDQEVAVFNVDGRLFAVGNKCPHRQGPLVRGKVEFLKTVPDTDQTFDPSKVSGTVAVRCPIHGWLFDLNSGQCLNQPQARVPAYSVTCEADRLRIQPQ